MDTEPTHYTQTGTTSPFVIRHPSQIEKEKRDTAYFLLVVWPEINGEEPTPPEKHE
jgi:hypothetical protein